AAVPAIANNKTHADTARIAARRQQSPYRQLTRRPHTPHAKAHDLTAPTTVRSSEQEGFEPQRAQRTQRQQFFGSERESSDLCVLCVSVVRWFFFCSATLNDGDGLQGHLAVLGDDLEANGAALVLALEHALVLPQLGDEPVVVDPLDAFAGRAPCRHVLLVGATEVLRLRFGRQRHRLGVLL